MIFVVDFFLIYDVFLRFYGFIISFLFSDSRWLICSLYSDSLPSTSLRR